MKKIRNGIWTINLHNHLLSDTLYKIMERASYVKFTLRTSYICSWLFLVITVCSYNYDLNYKHGNFFWKLSKVVFKVLSRPPFLRNLNRCLFFCNLKQVQIITETKLNHVNIKSTREYKGFKLSLQNFCYLLF